MDKFSALRDVISAKRMFGGYVIHYAGKVLGFIFEGEFLFEPGPTIDRLLPDAERKELFPGSKLFVIIEDSIGAMKLCGIAEACYDDFPISKPRKKKSATVEREKENAAEIAQRFPFTKSFGE